MESEQRPRGSRWRWLALVLLLIMGYLLSGESRSLGLHPIRSCPQERLSASEVQALFEEGVRLTEVGKSGEHYQRASLDAGLPLLQRAALYGHMGAIDLCAGLFITLGGVEVQSVGGLSYAEATAEGMMWSIFALHLGAEVPEADGETYRVLLDPELPFPEGFFDSPTGIAWMFKMLTPWGLEWARSQAYALSQCTPHHAGEGR